MVILFFLVFQMFQDGIPLCRHNSDFIRVCTWLHAYVSIHDGKYMAVYTHSCYQRSHLFFHILDPCTIAESFFKTKVLYAHYFFLNLGACHCLETMEVDSLLQQLSMTLVIKITYYQYKEHDGLVHIWFCQENTTMIQPLITSGPGDSNLHYCQPQTNCSN